MPFSLTSYLLGVGTIAGAIAFGVGTGVLMSKSALKDTPAQTRVERVARVEPVAAALAEPAPAAAPPVAEAKENPAPPIAAAVAAPSHQPDPAPSAQPETPKAPPETSKTEARTDAGEKPPEAVKQADARKFVGPVPLPPPPPPTLPPNMKFFGYGTVPNGTSRRAFLADGDDVYIVAEGDTLLGRYRIVRVNNSNLEFEEISSGRRNTVSLSMEDQPAPPA